MHYAHRQKDIYTHTHTNTHTIYIRYKQFHHFGVGQFAKRPSPKWWKCVYLRKICIIILDTPLGMPHTKFEPNWMKTLGYIKLFPKFKLKIWYVFYIKGFQPLRLWLAITSRKINIFQNFQKILKDIFIYNNILKF